MTVSAWSVSLSGLEGSLVEVEAALGGGLPRVVLVGLPDAALNEAKDRVKAAVNSSDLSFPSRRLTINLSPAGRPKNGTHYDLAIAAATLAVNEQVPGERVQDFVLLGELGLDGRVRRVRGILPALLAARRAGFEKAIVPAGQSGEASLVPGLGIWPVNDLHDLKAVLEGRTPKPEPEGPEAPSTAADARDLREVHGHADGRWALEVAAAGRHHLLLHGAPGVGKTMLASRLPGILPELGFEEAIEVSAIHSLAGHDIGSQLVSNPPYADPHHSATMASLIGGGSRDIRPGAISLAHNGVLFLDEAPEFGARLLDALRTPLESGWVTIARANQQVRYPANFQLVLAANPCPCGNSGVAGKACRCQPMAVRRYQERISGPILDRMDIQHQMLPLKHGLLGHSLEEPESSAAVAQRVLAARDRQVHRLRDTPWKTNSQVSGSHLRKRLPLPQDTRLLERALVRGAISARGLDKVLRIAWTLSDLADRDGISEMDLRVAMQMRQGQLLEAV